MNAEHCPAAMAFLVLTFAGASDASTPTGCQKSRVNNCNRIARMSGKRSYDGVSVHGLSTRPYVYEIRGACGESPARSG